MNRIAGIESKILDHFRTAPINEARLLLTICTGEVKKRSAGISLDISKTASAKKPAAGKRGRPRKNPLVATPVPAEEHVNAHPSVPIAPAREQAGEPVAVEAILG